MIDARKVRISGGWAQYMDGNERVGLVVGEEKRLVFDVSQAGPGKTTLLPVDIYHPSLSRMQLGFISLFLEYFIALVKNNIEILIFFVKNL